MKTFPTHLTPDNKERFHQMSYDRVKAYMRKDMYELILRRKSEDEYFDSTSFAHTHLQGDTVTAEKMMRELSEELQKLGWRCKVWYGDTGLFIYSTDNPPAMCSWEE